MNTTSILQLWHSNVELIIGILCLIIFALLGIFLFMGFWKEKEEAENPSAGADLEQIEDTLKKLLDKADVPGGGEDVEKLKVLVSEKEELIKKLEAAVEEAKSEGGGDAASVVLQDKIKDLEARLAEYEIIEDDIADLSMFKEENLRLKDELEI